VEVKTWLRLGFDQLEYALNERKKRRIIAVSREFLHRNPEYLDREIRYDIVFIGSDLAIEHIPGAFTESL